ncbi:MAG TPA: tetratricopeptide repeat protein [Candidatus Acidoferrales bacterium]|nr:tetratricopeptide repeat protein [Candidatus Acidoferrales bacterium]
MSSILPPTDGPFAALYNQAQNFQAQAAAALNRGATALQANNYATAIQQFRAAAAYSPGDATPYRYIGQAYGMQGDLTNAIKALVTATKVDPQNQDAQNDLANAYISNNDYTDAEPLLLNLEKLNPGNPGPATTLGFIYLNQGRLAEADTQFSSAIRMAPTSATAYYNLGLVRNKQGDYSDAVKLFQQAISINPLYENAHADLAYAYMGLNLPDQAKNEYKTLLAIGTTTAQQLAPQVDAAINTPKLLYEDPSKSNFDALLGPNTQVSTLDPSLATPGASKVFKLTFAFNQAMNVSSVLNATNWTITRGSGGPGGAYDYGITPLPATEAPVSIAPLSITYDPSTSEATVYFRVTQNAAGNATIDPSHLVFTFSGEDQTGRPIDKSGDQYDGYAITPF